MSKYPRTIHGLAAAIALFAVLVAVPASAQSAESAQSPVVNVNSATQDELALLPRVGPSVASRIVEHRDQNGRFKKPEELLLVRGIGEKTFELISPYVVLTGNTTLREKVRSSSSSSSTEPSANASGLR